MKKITLIYPYADFDKNSDTIQIPYGLFCLGSYLDYKGYKVKILDTRINIKSGDNINKQIIKETKDADIVGFSVLTANIENAIKMSDLIKENSKTRIIWGGIHPSLFPEQTCKDKSIDYVCRGEGEEVMDELLKGLPLKKIKGLVYKNKEKIIINEERKPIKLEEQPPLNWNLIKLNAYIKSQGFSHGVEKAIYLQASRGCPYRCTFCVNRILKCYNNWRPKKIETLMNEIKYVTDKYNLSWIKFVDENFFVNKKRAIEISKRIIKEGYNFKWNANIIANYFDKKFLTDKDLKIAVKSGLKEVDMGAESGSNKILNKLKKDITRKQLINSAKRCNQFNIVPIYSFMIGIPDETEKDMMDTVSVMKDISDQCPEAVFLGPHIYRPYPGGELYEEVKKLGFKEPENLREWPEVVKESENKALAVGDRTGYTTYDQLTWVKNPKLVKNIVMYSAYAAQNPLVLMKRKKFLTAGFALISKARFKTNFWAMPYEHRLATKLLNVIHKGTKK